MSTREEQFLAVYRRRRFEDQRAWYRDRLQEYGQAHDQVITWSGISLFGSSAAGLAAASDVAGLRVGWGLIAAAMAALATLIDAYGQMIGYQQNAKVYRDALAALGSLHPQAPWLAGDSPSAASTEEFVRASEAILQREMNQWGQLVPKTKVTEPRDEG